MIRRDHYLPSKSGSVIAWRGPIFAPIAMIEHALFCENSDMTGRNGSSGVKARAEQQSRAIENLGPGQFGQCSKSIVVLERAWSRL
jgi:hypothetical protein